jgi:hypothetical protein
MIPKSRFWLGEIGRAKRGPWRKEFVPQRGDARFQAGLTIQRRRLHRRHVGLHDHDSAWHGPGTHG